VETRAAKTQQSQIDINVYHVVMLARLLLPRLKARFSSTALLVNSSAAYMKWFPAGVVYSATKAFITQFTQGLAIELHNSNVDVQCLNPFGTATNIVSHWGLKLVGTPCSKVIGCSLDDLGRSRSDCL
jgi:short-subunit dehydrogenase